MLIIIGLPSLGIQFPASTSCLEGTGETHTVEGSYSHTSG